MGIHFKLTPNNAGSVTPKYAEIHAGIETCFSSSFFLCKYIIARTADPWAILDKAIIGHSNVPPTCAINWRSIAFVIWCNPVITSGAYINPNTPANNQLNDDVNPE